MKLWTVYYCSRSVGKTKSRGFDERESAVKFLAGVMNSGGHMRSLKWDGKNASPRTVLAFERESDRFRKANSN